MKKIRLIKFSILVAALAGIWSACTEERDLTYKGPTVVEFKNYYLEAQARLGLANFSAVYPNIVPSENLTLTGITVRQTPAFSDSILVQLVGPQRATPTTITYTISAPDAPGIAAVAGVHFNVVRNPVGTLIIPANSSSGYIYVDVLTGLGPTDPARVGFKIELQGSGDIQPSENYKTFTYNIIK